MRRGGGAQGQLAHCGTHARKHHASRPTGLGQPSLPAPAPNCTSPTLGVTPVSCSCSCCCSSFTLPGLPLRSASYRSRNCTVRMAPASAATLAAPLSFLAAARRASFLRPSRCSSFLKDSRMSSTSCGGGGGQARGLQVQ
jgi:hypothetical protein